MNKQQLANKIWESANKMRSKIEANEYKDYILGFIFYKYLSDYEVRLLKEEGFAEEDIEALSEEDDETTQYVRQNLGYFIAYDNLYSTWLKKGKDFDVSNVTDALSAFSRLIHPSYKKVFENIFQTLETGLSKLGDSSGARTKAISGLLQLIKDIPMDGKQDYDVLGFIYEYLISNFAANAGKKAGEFYTPHEVSLLMSEIVANHLKGHEEIKIYDPTSGSGSLLINIGHSVSKYMSNKNNIKYYAQELKENTYNLTRMNLIMRGIIPANIVTRNGDTLEDDWPYFEDNDPQNTYEPLYVDAVVSNPPYSQNWDPSGKEQDPRFKRFGLAPKSKADYAFLLHNLYHIKPDGIVTIVLPHGVLFRGGEEGTIRKNLIENNHIDAIIGLPANIFYGTGIPTIIMVLKQKRENTDVLIIDASKGFVKEGKNNKLRACDIKKISDTVAKRVSIESFSKVVSREEIRANDYNLNIPRYVDSSQKAESWDVYATMFGGIPKSELDELNAYWNTFPRLKQELFQDTGTPYVTLLHDDVQSFIRKHSDVLNFTTQFDDIFHSFSQYLKSNLLDQMETLDISKTESMISNEIFQRLQNIPLVDPYDAYQLLDDEWSKIAIDLEMIQTEGTESIKKVDPNLVLKKKGGKEEEIQEGWTGHVLPFTLVQETLLKKESDLLKEKESRLSQIPSELEAIAGEMSEDEKDGSYYVDESFVAKEVTKKIKELKKSTSSEDQLLLKKLNDVDHLFSEEKVLKAEIKKDSAALHELTKDTIESLADEQVEMLLEKKWITSLINNLYQLPKQIINNLVQKVQALQKKYASTYLDIEREIRETEKSLCSMIDDLEGSEFDMKGLNELKILLSGDNYG
ncbi:Type I restriction enzyme EcoKI M protein [Clostridiales bacterium CHKCI006]|nr:Type I restriction enzyme EcoKI M protein [Clostridiales bacterium CHKCI006]